MAAARGGAANDPVLQRQGRILILAELHARLDALVLQAYGWPAGISGANLLGRLAELNLSRRRDEQAGQVLWLRETYQRHRFTRSAVEIEMDLPMVTGTSAHSVAKRPFPADPEDQSEAVWEVLIAAAAGLTIFEAAAHFRSRRRTLLQDVEAALLALAQYGHVGLLPDGRFLARRAA